MPKKSRVFELNVHDMYLKLNIHVFCFITYQAIFLVVGNFQIIVSHSNHIWDLTVISSFHIFRLCLIVFTPRNTKINSKIKPAFSQPCAKIQDPSSRSLYLQHVTCTSTCYPVILSILTHFLDHRNY